MAGRSPAGWLSRVRSARIPDQTGQDAARRLIEGDVDGAFAAARIGRTARTALPRSEAYVVLTWAHLVRGERVEAERAASVVRRSRTPDPLLTVALVVASGGPSRGAASALAATKGILSLVGATRVFVDHGRLADVLDEIAGSPTGLARAALESLEVGLVAVGRQDHVDDVADRLASLGTAADRYATYAIVLGAQDFPDLAVAYLGLAARRGFADVAMIDADESLADARRRPAFEPIRADILANARPPASPADPPPVGGDVRVDSPQTRPGSGDRGAFDGS